MTYDFSSQVKTFHSFSVWLSFPLYVSLRAEEGSRGKGPGGPFFCFHALYGKQMIWVKHRLEQNNHFTVNAHYRTLACYLHRKTQMTRHVFADETVDWRGGLREFDVKSQHGFTEGRVPSSSYRFRKSVSPRRVWLITPFRSSSQTQLHDDIFSSNIYIKMWNICNSSCLLWMEWRPNLTH